MPKALTNGKIKIGAYKISDIKKSCLCMEEENEIVIYGYFNTFEGSEEFMKKLGELVGAKIE